MRLSTVGIPVPARTIFSCIFIQLREPLVRVPVLKGADHDAFQQPPFGFFRVDDRNYLSSIQLVLPFCSSSDDIRHCGARAAC